MSPKAMAKEFKAKEMEERKYEAGEPMAKKREELLIHTGEGVDVVHEAVEIVERAMARPISLEAAPKEIAISDEIAEKARLFIENYVNFLSERTEAYMYRMAEARPEAAEPTLVSGYQYWNCLTVGPIQFTGNPPYRPSKIIAAGEPTLMLGVLWINPANSDGGGLPGTVVLGGRHYRVCFETSNLSTVSDGPDGVFMGSFSNPASVINVFPWWFVPTDPGDRPNLLETTLTADIVETGQPLAAFSTWHVDLDQEPAFLSLPTAGAHLQFERPARFLVYRK